MAQKVIQTLIDDLDGTAGDVDTIETVEFSLDGVNYQIELTKDNAERLRGTMAEFIDAARQTKSAKTTANPRAKTGVGPGRQTKVRTKQPRKDNRTTAERKRTAAIRAWAREQGLDVSERGRIADDVVAAYDQAHAPKKAVAAKTKQTATKGGQAGRRTTPPAAKKPARGQAAGRPAGATAKTTRATAPEFRTGQST